VLALVRNNVSEECVTFIIRVKRIGELVTTLAISSCVLQMLVTANVVPISLILITLMETIRSSETSVFTSYKAPDLKRQHSSNEIK
jgi:hypothetical protein